MQPTPQPKRRVHFTKEEKAVVLRTIKAFYFSSSRYPTYSELDRYTGIRFRGKLMAIVHYLAEVHEIETIKGKISGCKQFTIKRF